MNKSDLIQHIAQNAEITQTAASKVLNTLTDTITKTLSNGESVAIVAFGNFVIRDRSAKTGRNPQTGETIQIKASKTIHLKRVKH